jgi:hypothetical protein
VFALLCGTSGSIALLSISSAWLDGSLALLDHVIRVLHPAQLAINGKPSLSLNGRVSKEMLR